MNILKKLLAFIIVSILLFHSIENTAHASQNISNQKPLNVGVFLVDLSNAFNSDLKKSLEELQKESGNKIKFTVFDGKANQSVQNDDIARELDSNFDVFVVAPISSNEDQVSDALNKIIDAKHPLILFFPTTPELIKTIKTYPASVIIVGDTEQGGTLEGKILADEWKSNKGILDKNKDDKIQYVILKGPSNNLLTSGRSLYPIRALNDAGIKTEELFSTFCNWQRECAKTAIESQLLTFNGKIEAIISNNDNMAIGAIEALQKYGFNKGDKSKYIPVVGLGGVPEAKKLIDQGFMTGTIVQDSKLHANAIYDVAMNLASGKDPIAGTDYKYDETGITIKIPYYVYIKK
ncbi:substrate-binding domain-containing protein [Clostridium chromiireducens]|uniref:D-galactose/methyl-galactoside binding periplasmic protein MglB n=1 Tax=Clostridium chromiireducens TaxID=225345 RepID=A0A964W583_9CLOT|nr:galactose ABC transporter substrate-binding protein [Clostridium chromiireducens]MVX67057.1 substrate-binding domain-containing protein [Clostridium chromiireducens]